LEGCVGVWHLCRASSNIDGPRELGLVAGELGPQSGDRGGVIRRDSASLVFFALDSRLKSRAVR
jgi:hypothetical protein